LIETTPGGDRPGATDRAGRLRVLLLNHNVAWRGGTFFRAFYFGRELARLGHRPTLVTISAERKLGFSTYERDGVQIVESPDLLWGIGRTGWDGWDTLNRIGLVRERRFDIVHAFDCRPAVIIPALAAVAGRSTPLVLDWADWWGRGGTISERPYRLAGLLVGGLETFFEEAFRTRATATTVISRALGERAQGLGVPAATISRIPQGCDTEGIRPLPKAEARQRLGIPVEQRLIGHLGVLLRRDSELLLTAAERLLRADPQARLVLIGNHTATIPETLRASGQLIETGFVAEEDLPVWLAACDVLTLPLIDSIASRGRWPSKANAYLAAGRPIVGTDVGDFAALMQQHDVGIVTAADADGLAAGLTRALDAGDQHAAWGANARALAEGELSWSHLIRQLEAVYTRALTARV
jgi:glycosyltransferase involved in cell wall biosynthesis